MRSSTHRLDFRPSPRSLTIGLAFFGLSSLTWACSASDTGSVDAGSGGSIDGAGGGLVGTGGAATGGAGPASGGTASGGDGSGGTTSTDCSAADILCETFDSAVPSGAPWVAKTCSDSNYSMTISAGAGEAGSGALLTSGASSGANTSCPLHYELPELAEFWVRARIKIGGANPAAQHEVTFFELGEKADADDPELRIGYRGDSSCNNSGAVYAGFEIGATKGPGGEFTGCTGTVPLADTWYCLEVHVDQNDPTTMYSNLYSNGAKLNTLVHSQPKDRVEALFKANYLKVGMQSYSGVFDSLLIDEISVSTERLPCE